MQHKLKFQIVDQSCLNGKCSYCADMSDIDNSGRWIICPADNGKWNAGIEHSDEPNTMPVKWLLSGVSFNEARQYLRTMHQTGQNYNSFN